MPLSTETMCTAFPSACASSEGEFPSLQLRLLCSPGPDAQSIPAQSARLSLSHRGWGDGEGGAGWAGREGWPWRVLNLFWRHQPNAGASLGRLCVP